METPKTTDEVEDSLYNPATLLDDIQFKRSEFLKANFEEFKEYLEEVAHGKGALAISLGRSMADYILSEMEISRLYDENSEENNDDEG